MDCLFIALLFTSILKLGVGYECTTPSGRKGNCIPIHNCEELYKALETLNQTQIAYVQRSQCGYDKTPLVCCPRKNDDIEISVRYENLFENRRYCGYQHSDDYISSETPESINIDEFPWMVSILYTKKDTKKPKIFCNGVLLNAKYVLTAAYCTTSANINIARVRLGEYNLKQDKDCRIYDTYFHECSDPVQEYGIANIIVHPGFKVYNRINDIALLKLNETVGFTDFIRPICLPTPDTKLAKPGEFMALSGWGDTSFNREQASIKKKVLVELLPQEKCQRQYDKSSGANITNMQICTKYKTNTVDIICRDFGAPVMFANRNQWHVEGIYSFGIGCREGFPAIHTKVASYVDWIEKTVQT